MGAAVGAGVLPALLFMPIGALDALIQGVFVVGLTDKSDSPLLKRHHGYSVVNALFDTTKPPPITSEGFRPTARLITPRNTATIFGTDKHSRRPSCLSTLRKGKWPHPVA